MFSYITICVHVVENSNTSAMTAQANEEEIADQYTSISQVNVLFSDFQFTVAFRPILHPVCRSA